MSDEQHLHRLEILAFIEGAVDEIDDQAISKHVQQCAKCFEVYEELSAAVGMLSDGEVVGHLEDEDEAAEDFLRGLLALEDEADSVERDTRAADALLLQLALEPVERWEAIIGADPHICTSALVRRLVDAAEPEMHRQPEHAHMLLRIAQSVADRLPEAPASFQARGLVWKQRANALRIQTRYEEALDAAIVAKSYYANLREPDTPFEVGQVHFTIAAILFEMTRFEPALREVTAARELLSPYGMSVPLAKVMMLEALIRAERGDVVNARETLGALVPTLEQLGQPLELGRVRTNLAECNLRLGDLHAAMAQARAAIDTFRALGNVTEETRGEWMLAMIRVAGGESEAIGRLYEIAAVYTDLGMPGEAGFVKLDVTAELLRHEQWEEAETLARELVPLFTAAGVTVASVDALHYLRRAVENRDATAATVQYVRAYVAADDVNRPFAPPAAAKPN
jgi:tetratricopeptide (TPR) repeat protein